MSERQHEPQQLLESLLSPDEPQPAVVMNGRPPDDDGEEDVDALVDELEALLTESRRMPFGRRLMIDEGRALDIVDRLRTAIPAEVRQARRLLDERDQLLDAAHDEARRTLHERGLMAELDVERERMLAQVERETERMRQEADAYVRGVLNGLADRITKIQASVNNGIEALNPPQA